MCLLTQLIVFVQVDFGLVFEDEIFYQVAIIDELVDLEKVHAVVFLFFFYNVGDLGKELFELGRINFLLIFVHLVKDLIANLLLGLLDPFLFFSVLACQRRGLGFLAGVIVHGQVKQLFKCLLLIVIVLLEDSENSFFLVMLQYCFDIV